MVVGNWGWMVGGSRWFVVDSVWVISFIELFIKRAQKSLEIRAKFVARKSTYGYTLCFGVSAQACLLVHVLQNNLAGLSCSRAYIAKGGIGD